MPLPEPSVRAIYLPILIRLFGHHSMLALRHNLLKEVRVAARCELAEWSGPVQIQGEECPWYSCTIDT